MSGIYEFNGDELHGDGREVHEPDSSLGKPSVCPECNGTGIVECSADYPGESNVMKCPNERHSPEGDL